MWTNRMNWSAEGGLSKTSIWLPFISGKRVSHIWTKNIIYYRDTPWTATGWTPCLRLQPVKTRYHEQHSLARGRGRATWTFPKEVDESGFSVNILTCCKGKDNGSPPAMPDRKKTSHGKSKVTSILSSNPSHLSIASLTGRNQAENLARPISKKSH